MVIYELCKAINNTLCMRQIAEMTVLQGEWRQVAVCHGDTIRQAAEMKCSRYLIIKADTREVGI